SHQCRSGPQGAEEEDAARGHFPRDEAPRPLRKTLREKGAREGGSDPPGAQARAQAHAARRLVADEAAAHPGRPRRSDARSAPTELLIDLRGGRPRPERGVDSDATPAFGPALSFWAVKRYGAIVERNNDRREAGEDARWKAGPIGSSPPMSAASSARRRCARS